jgi:hypothetical protein
VDHDGGLRRGRMPRADQNRDIVQPHDPAVVMIDRRPVVIVGFEVPVHDGLRVIGITLVDVLRRRDEG